jgi:DNA-binding transcriptional MerR regulator
MTKKDSPMKESFTKKEVAKITGLPLRSIQFLSEQGAVPPDVDVGGGRGKFRRWSTKSILCFFIAGDLSNFGMTISEIKIVISHFNFLFMRLPNIQHKEDFFTRSGKPLGFYEFIAGFVSTILIYKGRNGIYRFEIRLGYERYVEDPFLVWFIQKNLDGKTRVGFQYYKKKELIRGEYFDLNVDGSLGKKAKDDFTDDFSVLTRIQIDLWHIIGLALERIGFLES